MFFCSPVKLVKLIMSASSTAAQIGEYQRKTSSAWYKGEEGETACKKAITPAAKMQFFQSYLNAVAKEGTDREIVALTAYVITCGIDGTSLPFATFPDILEPKANPIVKIISEKAFSNDKRLECGIEMLNALLGGSASEASEWFNPEKRAYERLERCSNSQSFSAMYKLQRCIIGAFCCLESKSSAPYIYDIVSSAKIEGIEDSEEIDNEQGGNE